MFNVPMFVKYQRWEQSQIEKLKGWLESGSITKDEFTKKIENMLSFEDYCKGHQEDEQVSV